MRVWESENWEEEDASDRPSSNALVEELHSTETTKSMRISNKIWFKKSITTLALLIPIELFKI